MRARERPADVAMSNGGRPPRCTEATRHRAYATRAFALALVAGWIAVAALADPALAAPGLLPAAPVAAAVDAPAAATATGPIEVQVIVWLHDVRDIHLEQGSFAIDATLELRWQDPRMRADSGTHFEIMNAMEMRADSYGHETKAGWDLVTFRLHGRLRADFDLRRYPFDVHRLPMAVEHPLLQVEQLLMRSEVEWRGPPGLNLRRDRLGPDFTMGDWTLVDVSSGSRVTDYGLGERYSRTEFAITVARDPLRFFLADLAPIALMVLLGLAAALIPSDKIDAKLLLTVLALLVAVELQTVAAERLPPVGYMTIVDWMYGFAYAALALSVLQSIVEYRSYARGDAAGARRIGKWMAASSALIFFVPVAVLLIERA